MQVCQLLRFVVGDNALSFAHNIVPIRSQVRDHLFLPIGPQNLSAVNDLMTAQSKMKTHVVLRKIASSAEHFPKLHQVSRSHSHSRVQRKPITLHSLQLKADPMIFRAALRPKDHRLADEILDNRFHSAVVEQIAYGESSADL